MVSELRRLEDAVEPIVGPTVSKSITFLTETSRTCAPSRTSGFVGEMHLFVVDAIRAIDSRSDGNTAV